MKPLYGNKGHYYCGHIFCVHTIYASSIRRTLCKGLRPPITISQIKLCIFNEQCTYVTLADITHVCQHMDAHTPAGFVPMLCGDHWVACDWTGRPLAKEPCPIGLLWWHWDSVYWLPLPQGPWASSWAEVLLLLCWLWAADLCRW